MIRVADTLVSDDILECHFCCPVSQCKGLCCKEGDTGAPLEKEETGLLQAHATTLTRFLSPKSGAMIRSIGAYIRSPEGILETPLLPNGECVYAIQETGVFRCGIEVAFKHHIFPFPKPISCHLYPIRIRRTSTFTILNLHQWDICESARSLGKKIRLPVYRFLKPALIRRFSQTWYDQLEELAKKA